MACHSKPITNAPNLSLQDLVSLEGTVHLVRTESNDGHTIFYPVRVEKVSVAGCSIKATVHPINGLGRFDICCSELYSSERAMQHLKEEATIALRDEEYGRVVRHPYHQQRAANFALLVEQECDAEEQEMLKEENKGQPLHTASDNFIQKHARRILNRKYNLPDDSENDYYYL